MLHFLRSLIEDIRKLDDTYRDRRSENYFFLNNAWHMFALVVIYYIFVKHLGPKIMANRKPFELKWVLYFYNIAQVLLNLHFGIKCIYHLLVDKPYNNVFCMTINMGDDYLGHLEVDMAYTYFMIKIIDYLDTVFFVLRKRYNQITFLHVYHHIMVSVFANVFLRYAPGGQLASFCLLNAFVHTIMYSYYFLSALRPELKQSLWWKKYITQIQLLQFIILLVHNAVPLIRGNCAYPRWVLQIIILQNIIMLLLFSKFYYKAYIRKPISTTAPNKKMALENSVMNGKKLFKET